MIKTPFLLLSLVMVGGASLPPGPCGTAPAPGSTLPSHLDMPGSAGGGVSGLGNESADILHGLPTTERLRSPYESQR